jgi:Protein of unknown function (DUF2948)
VALSHWKKNSRLAVLTSPASPGIDVLHLTALDADDLTALSAQMQDAVLKVGDMVLDQKRRTFACVANRFAWDNLPEKTRRRTGLRINHVMAARRKHPRPVGPDSVLSLLGMTFAPKDDVSGTLTLNFSGGHAIALDVDSVDVQLDDLGPAWGTEREPDHGA